MTNNNWQDSRGNPLESSGIVYWRGQALTVARCPALFAAAPSVRLYRSNGGMYCVQQWQEGQPVASLIWYARTGEIECVLTAPGYRRHGIARALLAVGRAFVDRRIVPGDCLTVDGLAWAKAVA